MSNQWDITGTLQVKTGDSSSCTSLSIWIRMLTVISSSALSNVSASCLGRIYGATNKICKRL